MNEFHKTSSPHCSSGEDVRLSLGQHRFESGMGRSFGPVVQWLRRLVLSQEARVRFPPGLFTARDTIRCRGWLHMPRWSNGKDARLSPGRYRFDSGTRRHVKSASCHISPIVLMAMISDCLSDGTGSIPVWGADSLLASKLHISPIVPVVRMSDCLSDGTGSNPVWGAACRMCGHTSCALRHGPVV